MGLLTPLGFDIDGNLGPFKKRMAEMSGIVSTASAGMGRSFGNLSRELGSILTKVSAVAAVIGGLAVRSAMSFEQAMANARTMTDLTDQEWASLEGRVRGLMSEFGVSDFGAVGSAVFSAFSSGAKGSEEALELVRVAMKNYVAQGTDMATTIEFITQQWKVYGRESGGAEDQVDRLASATLLAKASQEEFASSLTKVSPLAKAAGVSQIELFAAVADLSQALGNSTEASTAFRALLNSLLTPTEKQREALDGINDSLIDSKGITQEAINMYGGLEGAARAFGVEFVEFGPKAVEAAGGLFPFLNNLTGKLNQTEGGARGLVESVEGFGALLAFAESEARDFGSGVDAISASTGRLTQQFEIVDETASQGFAKLFAIVKELGLVLVMDTGFMEDFKAVLTAGTEAIKGVVASLREWIEASPEEVAAVKDNILTWGKWLGILAGASVAIKTFGPLVAALVGFLGSLGGVAKVVAVGFSGVLLPALKLLGGAILALLSPLGIVIGTIALFGATLVVFWDDLKWGVSFIADAIVDTWQGVGDWFVGLWDGILDGAVAVWEGIVDGFTFAADWVKGVWGDLIDWFGGLPGKVAGFFGFNEGGSVGAQGFAGGGLVTGAAGTDTIPAFLTRGEFVINAKSAAMLGTSFLEALNSSSFGQHTRPSVHAPISIDAGGRPGVTEGWIRDTLAPELQRVTERALSPRVPSIR